MTKIACIGNCHAEKLQELFSFMNSTVMPIPLDGIHKISNTEREKYLRAYEESDFILTQNIADDYHIDYVTTNFIRKNYPSKVVTFSNFWFNGYDPSFIIFRDIDGVVVEGPLGPNHFRPVIRAYCLGESPKQAVQRWCAMQDFEEEALRLTANSLSESERRDLECDVKCGHWLRGRYQDELICHTVNHPSAAFLIFLANEIFRYLGLRSDVLYESMLLDYQKLNFISIAPNPFIHSNINLKFELSHLHRGYECEGSTVDLSRPRIWRTDDLVLAYYQIYESRWHPFHPEMMSLLT